MLLQQQTVLIVDDQKVHVEILVTCLKKHYRTRVALNGEQAVRQANLLPHPDLILLDVMMPDIDGFEVCRRLKANPATRAIPILFITGMGQTEHEVKGFALGAVDYVRKPINPVILLARLKTHLTLGGMIDRATGVPNRMLFHELLKQEIRRCTRHKQKMAVGFLDVDLSTLGDAALAPVAIDTVLEVACSRVRQQAMKRDTDTLARMGVGEFALILSSVGDHDQAVRVSEEILQAVQEPFVVQECACRLKADIGICLFPDHGQTVDSLLNAADKALCTLRSGGDGGVAVYAGEGEAPACS
ncbi:MAG: response regulator [Magnetococcus sp. MYC-9]